jgi:hypothetical protein
LTWVKNLSVGCRRDTILPGGPIDLDQCTYLRFAKAIDAAEGASPTALTETVSPRFCRLLDKAVRSASVTVEYQRKVL